MPDMKIIETCEPRRSLGVRNLLDLLDEQTAEWMEPSKMTCMTPTSPEGGPRRFRIDSENDSETDSELHAASTMTSPGGMPVPTLQRSSSDRGFFTKISEKMATLKRTASAPLLARRDDGKPTNLKSALKSKSCGLSAEVEEVILNSFGLLGASLTTVSDVSKETRRLMFDSKKKSCGFSAEVEVMALDGLDRHVIALPDTFKDTRTEYRLVSPKRSVRPGTYIGHECRQKPKHLSAVFDPDEAATLLDMVQSGVYLVDSGVHHSGLAASYVKAQAGAKGADADQEKSRMLYWRQYNKRIAPAFNGSSRAAAKIRFDQARRAARPSHIYGRLAALSL